jgi:four helix bundle protein
MKYTRLVDLPCWQKAKELCRAVYRLINKQQFARDYSLKDQIWRAVGSVMEILWRGECVNSIPMGR